MYDIIHNSHVRHHSQLIRHHALYRSVRTHPVAGASASQGDFVEVELNGYKAPVNALVVREDAKEVVVEFEADRVRAVYDRDSQDIVALRKTEQKQSEELRHVHEMAPLSASVQARNVTRSRFEFQGARARRHRRRRWRAPAGSRPGARRSLASSMAKGRELRGLYGTKRLVNFLSSRCDYLPPHSSCNLH